MSTGINMTPGSESSRLLHRIVCDLDLQHSYELKGVWMNGFGK